MIPFPRFCKPLNYLLHDIIEKHTNHTQKEDEKEVYVLKWFWPELLWSLRYSGYLNLLCHQVSVLQYCINRNMSDQRCLFHSKDWNIGPENNHQSFENLWMCDYEHILRILGKFLALSYFPDFFTNCKISDMLACCRYICNLPLCKQPNGNSCHRFTSKYMLFTY